MSSSAPKNSVIARMIECLSVAETSLPTMRSLNGWMMFLMHAPCVSAFASGARIRTSTIAGVCWISASRTITSYCPSRL